MKLLLALLFFLAMQNVMAGQCRVNGGQWVGVDGGTITINVDVKATPGTGLIRLDGYSLQCRYSPDPSMPSRATDYWHTWNNALTPGPKFSRYKTGLTIHNRNYDVPVNRGISISSMRNNGIGVDLQTFMYINTSGMPGNPIDIRKGDRLGTLLLKQTNNTGMPTPAPFNIFLNAGNDLIFEPSTCTINANNPILIDFKQVDQTRIGENTYTTPFKETVRLNYRCPDPNINMWITITLKGASSQFNTDFLAISNVNLGAGLIRNGAQVGVNKSFLTYITNSSGGDDVTFSLVRKPGSLPAAGGFSGSGVLVMGVP